jgi:hypothetical protein
MTAPITATEPPPKSDHRVNATRSELRPLGSEPASL